MDDRQDPDRLAAGLDDTDPAVVDGALARVESGITGLDATGFRRAVDAVCSLFYIDTADRPDLEPAIERATALLAAQGERVVPFLLVQMQGSDIKSHIYLARVLGRIGGPAIGPLRELLATSEDAYSRTFALYSLGKMETPDLVRALPEVIGGMMHPDREVRDTAARTLGRLARIVPPDRLTLRRRREMFEALIRGCRDTQPAVRAKSMRSLGKMAGAGLLEPDQRRATTAVAKAALGESEEHAWDHAFIVRREARETLEKAGGG